MHAFTDAEDYAAAPLRSPHLVHAWLLIALRSWLRVVIYTHILVWLCFLAVTLVVHMWPRGPHRTAESDAAHAPARRPRPALRRAPRNDQPTLQSHWSLPNG